MENANTSISIEIIFYKTIFYKTFDDIISILYYNAYTQYANNVKRFFHGDTDLYVTYNVIAQEKMYSKIVKKRLHTIMERYIIIFSITLCDEMTTEDN